MADTIDRNFRFTTSAIKKYADFLVASTYGKSNKTFALKETNVKAHPARLGSLTGRIAFAILDRADYISS